MTEAIEGEIVPRKYTRQGKALAGLTTSDPQLTARQKRIRRMFVVEGMSRQEIAEATGLSYPYICDIISAIRKHLPSETRQSMIEEHLDELRSVRNGPLRARAMRGEANAVKAYIKVLESERKLLGLDAPTSVAIQADGQTVHYVIEDPDVEAMK